MGRLHHMALVPPACSQIQICAGLQLQPQTSPAMGLRQMTAELESAGHAPACHRWGLCRDTDFRWEWQVPIQHMPRGSGDRQHPCPSPAPDQGGSIQLLKTTVGRKGKVRQKGQMSPSGFYHQSDGNELRAAVLRGSYPEGNTGDWKHPWDITGVDYFESPLTPRGQRQEMMDLDPFTLIQPAARLIPYLPLARSQLRPLSQIPLLPRQVFTCSHLTQTPPLHELCLCSREIACVGRARAQEMFILKAQHVAGWERWSCQPEPGAVGRAMASPRGGIPAGNLHGKEQDDHENQLRIHTSLPATRVGM